MTKPLLFWEVLSLCRMIIGYARVSTDEQKIDSQLDALKAAGAEKVFADKITGTARRRPQLDRLLDQLRKGDVITVTKYDRPARSLRDLLDIVDTIQAHGAQTWSSRRQATCFIRHAEGRGPPDAR